MHKIVRLVVALLFAFAFALGSAALAHDDGHYAADNPQLHAWFDKLASGKGLCCSFVDGSKVEDVDWDTKADPDGTVRYRVRLNGEWIVVPPEAVVAEPNRLGTAVVWPYRDAAGSMQIRCFLAGAGG
jgi:hypothetical protein